MTPTCKHLEMDEKHFNQQFNDRNPEKATGFDNVTSKELILTDEAVKLGIKSIIKKSITDKKFPFPDLLKMGYYSCLLMTPQFTV